MPRTPEKCAAGRCQWMIWAQEKPNLIGSRCSKTDTDIRSKCNSNNLQLIPSWFSCSELLAFQAALSFRTEAFPPAPGSLASQVSFLGYPTISTSFSTFQVLYGISMVNPSTVVATTGSTRRIDCAPDELLGGIPTSWVEARCSRNRSACNTKQPMFWWFSFLHIVR